MSHRIVESRETEWKGLEKAWTSVQQYPPRPSWIGRNIVRMIVLTVSIWAGLVLGWLAS